MRAQRASPRKSLRRPCQQKLPRQASLQRPPGPASLKRLHATDPSHPHRRQQKGTRKRRRPCSWRPWPPMKLGLRAPRPPPRPGPPMFPPRPTPRRPPPQSPEPQAPPPPTWAVPHRAAWRVAAAREPPRVEVKVAPRAPQAQRPRSRGLPRREQRQERPPAASADPAGRPPARRGHPATAGGGAALPARRPRAAAAAAARGTWDPHTRSGPRARTGRRLSAGKPPAPPAARTGRTTDCPAQGR
mmetsp:Transcript_51010/g.165126  ORF Transcript_51010/g.165126 Transcript_51010/m.165126 type:complete len:244 (-) Transcript_51010:641-1372(-)